MASLSGNKPHLLDEKSLTFDLSVYSSGTKSAQDAMSATSNANIIFEISIQKHMCVYMSI